MDQKQMETLVVELEAALAAVYILAAEVRKLDPDAKERMAIAARNYQIAPSPISTRIRNRAEKLVAG